MRGQVPERSTGVEHSPEYLGLGFSTLKAARRGIQKCSPACPHPASQWPSIPVNGEAGVSAHLTTFTIKQRDHLSQPQPGDGLTQYVGSHWSVYHLKRPLPDGTLLPNRLRMSCL